MNPLPGAGMTLMSNWIASSPKNESECLLSNQAESGDCPPAWDDVFCWPSSSPNQVVSVSCSAALRVMGLPTPEESNTNFEGVAFRICSTNGEWVWGNWTNYTQCMTLLEQKPRDPLVVVYILFFGSLLSLVLLLASLFILFYFRTLEGSRIRVHRNLMISLVIHAVSLLCLSSPHVLGGIFTASIQVGWMCKTILCIKMYSSLSSINWMFIEGLILHQRVTTKIFDQHFPFRIYYLVAWGIPMAVIAMWSFLLSHASLGPCWEGYGDMDLVWIVIAPMLLALLINCVFLINIIRVLTLKLKRNRSLKSTSQSPEQLSRFKAVKATLLLFPLLGTTHLLFLVNPKDSRFEVYYMHFNAWLQSFQGVFVAVLYCFMSSDVQHVVRNCYMRANVRRGFVSTTTSAQQQDRNRRRDVKNQSLKLNNFELQTKFKKKGNNSTRKSSSFHGVDTSEVHRLIPIHKSCCVSINDFQVKTSVINGNLKTELNGATH